MFAEMIELKVSRDRKLGLYIKGGAEYDMGIYISCVDRGSVADEVKLEVGDQILRANDVSFADIPHDEAVNILKNQKHILLIVKKQEVKSSEQLQSVPSLPPEEHHSSSVTSQYVGQWIASCESPPPQIKISPSPSISFKSSRKHRKSDAELSGREQFPSSSGYVRTSCSSIPSTSAAETKIIDAKSRTLLKSDEYDKLVYYREEYQNSNMTIDAFIAVIMELFDTPDKRLQHPAVPTTSQRQGHGLNGDGDADPGDLCLGDAGMGCWPGDVGLYALLSDIRNIILPEHLDKFDELVYRREEQAMKNKLTKQLAETPRPPSSRGPRSSLIRQHFRRSHEMLCRDPPEGDEGLTGSEDSGVDLTANGGAVGGILPSTSRQAYMASGQHGMEVPRSPKSVRTRQSDQQQTPRSRSSRRNQPFEELEEVHQQPSSVRQIRQMSEITSEEDEFYHDQKSRRKEFDANSSMDPINREQTVAYHKAHKNDGDRENVRRNIDSTVSDTFFKNIF
ncbi:Whirlin [Nymphon striatum]|nr:Whirlin [Nymphon striatum]